MEPYKLGEMEQKFADLIWDHEPVASGELTHLCEEAFDWKRLFQQMARELDVRDVVYDRKIHQMQYAASMHGEEFLAWFNEAVYEPALTPRLVDEEKIQKMADV